VRTVIIIIVVLVLLPFLLAMISSFAWGGVRLWFARVQRCDQCHRNSLVFIEGLRPLADSPVDPSDLTRAYYECRDCGARFAKSLGRKELEPVDAARWRKVLATKWFYARNKSKPPTPTE
jgi:hypothetical protein